MTPEIAEAVVAYRQDKEIKSLQEIAGLLGEAQAQLAPYVTVAAGNTFTIESRGYKNNSPGRVRDPSQGDPGREQPISLPFLQKSGYNKDRKRDFGIITYGFRF